jgi:hypothetical protein
MSESMAALISRIELVFPCQPFPDMTLRQAQLADESMDRKISDAEWDETGRGDQLIQWTDIEPDVLIACDAALSHLSDPGFVYYIPAYMRLALNQMGALADPPWEVFGSTVSHLSGKTNYALGRYKVFEDVQIDVVIEFLRLVYAGGGFEGKMAKDALDRYWETPDSRRRSIVHLP